MAKKKTTSAPEPEPKVETKSEETPPESPPKETAPEQLPEAEEGPAAQQSFDAFLEDEADDLDGEETPPTPQKEPEPEEKVAEVAPPPEEAPPAVAPTPPAEPKPEEAAPTPTPVAPAPEPALPAAPVAAPAAEPAPVAAPVATMEEIRETYRKNRGELEKSVAETVYNLSEEQVQRLDDGDAALIPELMAKVYMDAMTGAVAHMITYLPNMMESVLAGRDDAKVYEDQFYDSWPNLDRAQHGELVNRLAMAYRQLNPAVPAEDVIRDVGAQVMVALRITPGNGELPPAETLAPKAPPFKPASFGGTQGAAPASTNPFETLADEMGLEELDVD